MDNIIEVKNVTFEYDDDSQKEIVLNNFSLDIKRGDFTVILGHNGSGKSTLAKLLNGLYKPTSGQILVDGISTADEETEIEIKQSDVRIDVMRAGGPGGQCVNTTDSAVRLTHIPTGLVVIQQDEKSQIKNKEKAFRVLRARLFDLEESKKQSERADARKSMVGSGARSEKIRTYNYPQDRVTDHRINYSQHNLPSFMMGDMDDMIDALNVYAKEEQLKADVASLESNS